MNRRSIPAALAGAVLLVVAGLGSGCATTAGSGGEPAVFIAPDGAHATPNTGASRLADGGLLAEVAPAEAAGPAAATAVADGVVFTWTGGGRAVSVAGEFNAWDPAADPLVQQADGTFRLVKKLTPGRYAYKFVVDGQWQPDPSAKETIDDGFGAKNSVVIVGEGTPSATPPSWTTAGRAAAAGAAAGAVTTADGTVFTWTGGGAAVSLAGEFNGWDQAADPMVKQADGSFRIVKKLAPGRYAYKFVVDGQWKPDPSAKETVDDGFGGTNSVAVVGDGAGAAGAAAGAGAAAAAPAGTGKGKAPEVTPEGVRFTWAGAARTVHLAGDFNAWSTSADPLARAADGTWTIVKVLPSGTHAYKFVVDGTTWKTDDANPNTVDDGFGGKNAVVTVP
jgi:1,4-alpha-glucan branching enzyme